jgi:hypothetical protein
MMDARKCARKRQLGRLGSEFARSRLILRLFELGKLNLGPQLDRLNNRIKRRIAYRALIAQAEPQPCAEISRDATGKDAKLQLIENIEHALPAPNRSPTALLLLILLANEQKRIDPPENRDGGLRFGPRLGRGHINRKPRTRLGSARTSGARGAHTAETSLFNNTHQAFSSFVWMRSAVSQPVRKDQNWPDILPLT